MRPESHARSCGSPINSYSITDNHLMKTMKYVEIVRVLSDIHGSHGPDWTQILTINGGLARLDFRQTGKSQMSGCIDICFLHAGCTIEEDSRDPGVPIDDCSDA